MPTAYRRPLSAKNTLEMGACIKSPLCVVGWNNVDHGLHFHYGDISVYA